MRIKNQFHPLLCAMVMMIYFASTLILVTCLNDSLAVAGLYIFVPGLFLILPNIFQKRTFTLIILVNGLLLDLYHNLPLGFNPLIFLFVLTFLRTQIDFNKATSLRNNMLFTIGINIFVSLILYVLFYFYMEMNWVWNFSKFLFDLSISTLFLLMFVPVHRIILGNILQKLQINEAHLEVTT